MRRFVLLLAACAVVSSSASHAAAPKASESDLWNRPAFALDAPALLSLRGTPDPARAVTILLNETVYTFEADGRCTTRTRIVFSPTTQASAEGWAIFEQSWSPWYQKKPEFRARVVTPDGAVHELDPATIADEPAGEGDPDLLGNRRNTRAPLPAMAAGVVVEEEVTVREERTLFAEGTARRHVFGWSVPVGQERLVIDAPEPLPLIVNGPKEGVIRGERSVSAGRARWTFAGGPVAALEHLESSVPSDQPQTTGVDFTTGTSWQRVATAYAAVVASRIGDAGLEGLVKSVVSRGDRPRAAAAKLLARVQRDIRYTGVEFDEATIVPSRPAETLKRRFGDCKDKATLLVALLETAGIPAHVALLSAGFGLDVPADQPGLGRFNHAIVYVPGPDPFWIDPTSEHLRAGELPAADCGRLALVASPATSALVLTPEATVAGNGVVETREFFLAESGPARVVETTEPTGGSEASYRDSHARSTAKELGEHLEKYVKDEYLAKPGIPKWEATDPADLARPFRLRIEVPKAGRGVTDDSEAVVALHPSRVTSSVPDELRGEDDEEPAEGDKPADGKKKPRVHDFLFAIPFSKEIRYRIVPPPGFTPLPLPENAKESIGTGTLTRTFAAEKDGVVTATLRFETGKRRVTAAEVAKWRSDLEAVEKSEVTFVRFQETGMAHLRAGRVREALDEFRRLAALHPKEALHRSQRALALLAGGLGEAARAEAREGLKIEPGSAEAHRALAWILQHDLVGRRFKKGWDRAGSIAEYRKAKELDPKDVIARADLAIVLEHDAEGTRYAIGAELPAAAAEYRAIRKELHDRSFDANLLLALIGMEDGAALAEEAKGMDASQDRTDALVLAAAMKDGGAAAVREANRLVIERTKRRETLQRIAGSLMRMRRYPRAVEILSEAIAGAPNEADLNAFLGQLRKARRFEELPLPADDPTTPVKRLFRAFAASDTGDGEELRTLFTASVRKNWGNEHKTIRAVRRRLQDKGLPAEVALDLAFAVLDFHAEGSAETGWRVRVRGANDGQEVNETTFVTKEEGALRIAAVGRGIEAAGWEIRRRVDAGDLAGARQWLDWVREDVWAGRLDDPYTAAPLSRFWTRGAEPDPKKMRLAADALLADTAQEEPQAIRELAEAREASVDEAEMDRLDHALASAYRHRKMWKELEPVSARLLASHPDSNAAFAIRTTALGMAGKNGEAQALAEERLRKYPGDEAALRGLARIAVAQAHLDEAVRIRRELVASGKGDANDYNELAWCALFTGAVDEKALEDARRSVDMTHQGSWGVLHTLAALDAEAGRPSEAYEVILKAIALKEVDEPEPNDWYVFGRIAELYGESAAASAAYARVTRPREEEPEAVSTWTLAQKRLAGLKAAAPPRKKPARAG